MFSPPTFRLALRTLALGLIVAHAHAADDADEGAERIDQLKAEARQLRDQAEATFQATEATCYERFMVNRCIDQAKQARLETIRRARELEGEARKLDLAERQRAAAEVMRSNPEVSPVPANPSLPASPSLPTGPTPSPSADAVIAPTTEAERLRAERDQAAEQAEAAARAAQAAKDAERARERSKANEAAAQRAEQAARERARYEERIREYEEKKARDAAGR